VSIPTVGVVTVSHNGLDHLQEFVPALWESDYPREKIRLLVVDNASSDGSAEWLKEQAIDTVYLNANQGFAYPNNLGVQKLDECEFIALLNNDTRVESNWLSPLVEALESNPSIAMAGAVLANWSGDAVDFSGGVVSYTGHAHHLREGEALPPAEDTPKDTLFVCGGAALLRRDLFLRLGGFDQDFFAYFEDVDFGWRAWLAGYRVVLVTSSVVRHRHQGTAARLPFPPRMRLYERNALASIIKNYGSETVWTAVAGSLLALFARAAAYSEFDVASFLPPEPLPSSPPDEHHTILSGLSAAQLLAAEDIAQQWDLWMAKRAAVQALRKREDEEFSHLFGDFAVPPLLDHPEYTGLHDTIIDTLGVSRLFSSRD
jgi:GT2 family glycosyltransferase